MSNSTIAIEDRVKFYSISDLSIAHYFPRVEKLLVEFTPPINLIETIELYHVKNFVNSGVFKNSWKHNSDAFYRSLSNNFPRLIGKFFDEFQYNMHNIYSEINIHEYTETFFKILVDYGFIKKWPESELIKIFENADIWVLLQCETIVKKFDTYIRNRIINSPEAAEIIIRNYTMIKEFSDYTYLPPLLTAEDASGILTEYVESNNPDLNYLTYIMLIDNHKLNKPEKVKFLARQRISKLENEFFSDKSNYISRIVEIKFEKSQKNHLLFTRKNNKDTYSYGLPWILNNLDFPTLLNNFIYLFEFVDVYQFRSNIINNRNLLGVFERYMAMPAKGAYAPGSIFTYLINLAKLQMTYYYNLLKTQRIRLEDIITFFFKDYLLKEFGINNFKISMPSENSTFYEKCTTIISGIDRVLKSLYCLKSEGYIEPGIIEEISTPVLFENLPSLVNKKYFVGHGDNFEKVSYYLCSDQCSLSFLEKYNKKKYTRFYQLVINEDIYFHDYKDIHGDLLFWLEKRNFLVIEHCGKISLTNRSALIVDLFKHEALSYWHSSQSEKKIIDIMLKEGYLKQEDLFFSKPERDFFNYMLNNRVFSDSISLRNKYSHGSVPVEKGHEKFHEESYYTFLILLIIIVIKINDELCILEISE